MEEYIDKFDEEINYIHKAIKASEYFEKEEKNSLDYKTLYDLYNTLSDGLISSEILIKNGPLGFGDHAKKLTFYLEHRLMAISLIAISKNPEFKNDELFICSPWIKKFKNKDYFESVWINYPKDTKEKMYSILFE